MQRMVMFLQVFVIILSGDRRDEKGCSVKVTLYGGRGEGYRQPIWDTLSTKGLLSSISKVHFLHFLLLTIILCDLIWPIIFNFKVGTGNQSSFKSCVIDPHSCVNWCLFNAAELLSAISTLPWPIDCRLILKSIGQDKHFIQHFSIQKPEGGFILGPSGKRYPPIALHSASQIWFFSQPAPSTYSLAFSNCSLLKGFGLPCLTPYNCRSMLCKSLLSWSFCLFNSALDNLSLAIVQRRVRSFKSNCHWAHVGAKWVKSSMSRWSKIP